MHTITPHLWFDTNAQEAVDFYVSLFPQSRVTYTSVVHGTPTGDAGIFSFELAGQPFMAINAGPYFTFNPSISFMINFDPSKDADARAHIDATWEKLAEGGKVIMPIQKYDFSERYGWIQDKYGVSWQLILSNPNGQERPFIVPSLLFTEAVAGQAGEAIDFYCSVFSGTRGMSAPYPAGMEPDREGTLMYADFRINDTWLAAMDSAREHGYTFNEAISLVVPCDTQEEIDMYWSKLSAHPESEQCGWLKDKYGVSWQIWPTALGEMMTKGTPEQVARVTAAFLAMKKFDISALTATYNG